MSYKLMEPNNSKQIYKILKKWSKKLSNFYNPEI